MFFFSLFHCSYSCSKLLNTDTTRFSSLYVLCVFSLAIVICNHGLNNHLYDNDLQISRTYTSLQIDDSQLPLRYHISKNRTTFVIVQLLSRVQLFGNPLTAACQASLSFTISQSLLKLMSIVGDAIQPSHPLSSPSMTQQLHLWIYIQKLQSH